MSIRSYKFRIYPTQEQKVLLAKTFGSVRYIYNKTLAIKTEVYQANKKSISVYELDKNIKIWKKEEETIWLKEVNSQALQSSLRNLDSAFTKFFQKECDYPRQKKKKSLQSFTNPQRTKVDFESGKVFIPKFLEGIKTIFHRQFEGQIKSSTVSRVSSGKYFISINVETGVEEVPIIPAKIESTIGIDLGIKTYATLSDGKKFENPKILKKKIKKLKRLSRQYSKKKKGSNNKEKLRIKRAKQHENVANTRKDFLHKLSRELVDNQDYQSFAIEDLAVANMLKNRKLSQAITDCSWGTFRQFLTYKANRAGKEVRVIGRFDPSSKMCSCGKINYDLKLKDREWSCSCGLKHDRDILAANNIRNFAFIQQNTQNDQVRPERPKHSRKRKTLLEIPVTKSLKEEIINYNLR